MSALRCWLMVFATIALSATAAMAQQSGNPCASDVKKLCAGIQPGEGRLKACMKTHLTGLTQSCEDRVLTTAVTSKTCKGDIASLCAGIVPGTGGIRACVKSRMAEVSDPCKDEMARAAAGRKLISRQDL